METMFINLDARRVTISGCEMDQKACVGQETVCYTVLPRRKRRPPAAGWTWCWPRTSPRR